MSLFYSCFSPAIIILNTAFSGRPTNAAPPALDPYRRCFAPRPMAELPDGKPNLAAKPPRGRDGHPDLSGIWHPEAAPLDRRAKYFKDGVNGLGEDEPNIPFVNVLDEYKPGDVDMTPAAAAVLRARASDVGGATACQPWGMPMVDTLPSPYRIVQNPGVTYILYEENMSHREIFTDGRKLTPDPQPTWLGYSVGRWEGDTFVVDSAGFNDRAPLDAIGHPHTEQLKITERFRRVDFGHMELQVAFDDPAFYTKSFSVKIRLYLMPDTDLIESFCSENEKDVPHLTAK
jgi:hypothetical protein